MQFLSPETQKLFPLEKYKHFAVVSTILSTL